MNIKTPLELQKILKESVVLADQYGYDLLFNEKSFGPAGKGFKFIAKLTVENIESSLVNEKEITIANHRFAWHSLGFYFKSRSVEADVNYKNVIVPIREKLIMVLRPVIQNSIQEKGKNLNLTIVQCLEHIDRLSNELGPFYALDVYGWKTVLFGKYKDFIRSMSIDTQNLLINTEAGIRYLRIKDITNIYPTSPIKDLPPYAAAVTYKLNDLLKKQKKFNKVIKA